MLSKLKQAGELLSPEQWRRVTIGAIALILAVHTGWICVHLWLVSNERINPWKLGGYGMYTVPHLNLQTHVFLFDRSRNNWAELRREDLQFGTFRFNAANDWHVFRCRPFDAEKISIFFEENPHLRFRPLLIVVTEIRFDRYPIKVTREAVQKVEIGWSGKEKFGFRGDVCGKTYSGTVAYTGDTT